MSEAIFQFNQVNRLVLQNITFTLREEDRLIIFGPSGAGKSTLLHLFNRMDDPDQGEVLFHNKPIEQYDIPQLRRSVGLVLQQPYLFPDTVLDNLKFGPSLFDDWEDARAERLMDYVNLPIDYLNKPVDELSGGEKQRVSLARTLANKPDVLLLDEPTSALDDRNIEAIEEDLIRLIEHNHLTVAMVTHSMDQAKRIGTKGLYIEEGQVIEYGDINQLLENPNTEQLKQFLHKS
ncbi:ABC transporter ATP-binding protein [Alkalibacillus haloalkaliphilus]|uniref:ABC transporter ATP-binding protein n=1 Tax=Alkalibacillus haloalkaliphilus TaxID=94136 RepID=UPI002935D3CE|nr:ATP-binding cassette domain-containing protein [Alkalibacillus haloalkaliphilus]MDV2580985.1 ATP-binding cassette domain-containing protein [Alkalibacillus haloalkaliphilus]